MSEFRKNLKSCIDNVYDNNDTLIVTGSGKTVVMISPDDFNSYEETEYLTSTKANKDRLDGAIKSFKNDRGKEQKLIEPAFGAEELTRNTALYTLSKISAYIFFNAAFITGNRSFKELKTPQIPASSARFLPPARS
nr:type II toxin-antitoxin system Phd/YefM family antitoxin [Niabella aurantiaca]